MGADPHHHQPAALFIEGAVLIGGIEARVGIVVTRELIGHALDVFAARTLDFIIGAVADEHRLAEPFHRQLAAFDHIGDIDPDRGQGAHVCGGVHLVHQRPDRGARGHDTGPGRCVIEEIPAGSFVIVCV